MVIIIPLIPMSVLLFSYQKHAKENLLQNHLNLAKMASSNLSEHIENTTLNNSDFNEILQTKKTNLSKKNHLFWEISFFSLLTRIQKNSIGKSGVLFLANENGEIINPKRLTIPDFTTTQLQNIFASHDNIIKNLTFDKHIFVGAYYPTNLNGVYLISIQDKRELFHTINLITMLIIFFMLLTLTLSYFAALYFARKITEPMDQLVKGAKQISKRNFKTQIDETKSWGELKELLTTFNSMANQLDKYQKVMLEQKINQLKEDLFNSIAHDLKVPLLSAQGYLEGVKNKKIAPAKRLEYIESTKSALLDISTLIEDILDTARLESTKMKPVLKAHNFENLLDRVINELNYLTAQKQIKIVKEINTNTKIVCDKKLVQRLLLNLIANAIKFSKTKGKIKIVYSLEKNNFKVLVKDNGIGISKKDISNIFVKFHKTSNQKGYGLGLFISKLIVKIHGGKITATSTKAKGTTITFWLPRRSSK